MIAGLQVILKDIMADNTEWRAPCFIVLGSESCGKSSLLERLSMIPIFPRDSGIWCVRTHACRATTPPPRAAVVLPPASAASEERMKRV